MPAPSLKPLAPIDTVPLFPGLHAELMALLERLSPEDWQRPTLAPAWRVRDIVSHILDTHLRMLSAKRDGHRPPPDAPIDGYDDLVRYLNRLNNDWVAATARLSPRVLIELLALAGPQAAALLATLDPFAPAPIAVAWAGESTSLNWFNIGREYTEWWHHQAQVRDAVGARPLNDRRWLRPFLDISLRGLPHGYRAVEAPVGTMVRVEITGEAGGSWILRREAAAGTETEPSAARWTLLEGDVASPDAHVRLDADTAWRLLYNALPPESAARAVTADGDPRLTMPFLAVRTVMV